MNVFSTVKELWQIYETLGQAREFQESLYNQKPIRADEYTIYGKCCPAGVLSGDFFNFERQVHADGTIYTKHFIGDVAGHGMMPGLWMMLITGMFHHFIKMVDSPGEFNEWLELFVNEQDEDIREFVAVHTSILETDKDKFYYSVCGMPPGFIIRGDEVDELPMDTPRSPIGLPHPNVTKTQSITVRKGDRIVLATDGLMEAQGANGNSFRDKMSRYLADLATYRPETMVHQIMKLSEEFAETADDDRTAVVIARD